VQALKAPFPGASEWQFRSWRAFLRRSVVTILSGELKDQQGQPNERNDDAGLRRVEVSDAMEVVQLHKISAFKGWNYNFLYPSAKIDASNGGGQQPASEWDES
jgi:hypothetical protein